MYKKILLYHRVLFLLLFFLFLLLFFLRSRHLRKHGGGERRRCQIRHASYNSSHDHPGDDLPHGVTSAPNSLDTDRKCNDPQARDLPHEVTELPAVGPGTGHTPHGRKSGGPRHRLRMTARHPVLVVTAALRGVARFPGRAGSGSLFTDHSLQAALEQGVKYTGQISEGRPDDSRG